MGAVTSYSGLLGYWRFRQRQRLVRQVHEGKLSINRAREKLGLPPWEVPGMDVAEPWPVTPGGTRVSRGS